MHYIQGTLHALIQMTADLTSKNNGGQKMTEWHLYEYWKKKQNKTKPLF